MGILPNLFCYLYSFVTLSETKFKLDMTLTLYFKCGYAAKFFMLKSKLFLRKVSSLCYRRLLSNQVGSEETKNSITSTCKTE